MSDQSTHRIGDFWPDEPASKFSIDIARALTDANAAMAKLTNRRGETPEEVQRNAKRALVALKTVLMRMSTP